MRQQSGGQSEFVLENRQVLLIFFVVVALCGIFFALGYIVGQNTFSAPTTVAQGETDAADTDSKPSPMPPASYLNRPGSGTNPGQDATDSGAELSFYQSLQESPEPTLNSPESSTPPSGGLPASPPSENPLTQTPPPGILVQVSALTRREDAEALVELLHEKNLPVLVIAGSNDPLFRVVVGPYDDPKEAERVRTLLEQDGFRPFIKR